MSESQSTIGMPVEQGLYTLILGIIPKGQENSPLYFYNSEDSRVNFCTIYGVSIHESICDIISTCKIEVEVPFTWLDKQYLTDGSKISIEMKLNGKLSKELQQYNEKPYIYRIFSIDKIEDHGLIVRLIISGVTDFVCGYGDANKLNCSCTTSNVFDKCAKEYKFSQTDIDTTSDKQLWISNGRTIYQFLTYCCQYGWANKTSAMMWAIDRNKKLYYKNIVDVFNSGCKNGKCMNIRVGSLGVPVITSVPFGLNNVKLNAYGTDGDVFTLVENGESENTKYDYVTVNGDDLTKTSECTCVCKGCGCKSGQDWFSFNVGNHNKNYFRAAIQNKQILSTYSTFLSVRFTPTTGIVAKNSIVPFFEAFHLFDTANLTYTLYAEKDKFINMKALTSKCMVESIDINITQEHAATNVKFVTQGFNTKNNNKAVN